ncbi:MAG TPA: nucleotidyl transferase AbiEii/AbiGii toxin family protein, partial [Polyangiaceae bacterium]|nr:nucleotidyl transferase AbiEii/AbiGii toxin family protein [Polyangiaceae bacterium]
MHDDVLDPSQRAALSALKPAADRGFYLAGGTGLCLHLAHRRSVDLDLFRTESFDADGIARELGACGVALNDLKSAPATIHAQVLGVRTSLLAFPYAPLESPIPTAEGVPVAGLRDLAAMKIEAIAGRGARKDFYDLYFICQSGLSLDAAFDAFRGRFASASPDVYHRLRALTFFDDAEREPE